MKRSTLMVAVSMLAVFLSGIAVGGVGYRLYTVKSVVAVAPVPPKNPEDFRKKYISELNEKLKLQPEQTQTINSILDETRRRYRAEKERSKAEMKKIHDGQVEQVRSILSDSQKPVYEKFHEERERQMKEMEKKRKASGL
jgi:hypothetical protein